MNYYKKRSEATRRQRVLNTIESLCYGTGDNEEYPNYTINGGISVYVNPDLGHCVSLTFAGEHHDIHLRDIADDDGVWAILDSLLFSAPPSSREVFRKTQDWLDMNYVVVNFSVVVTDFENEYGIKESDLSEAWFQFGQCDDDEIIDAFEGQEWDYNGTWVVRAVLLHNEAQESSEAHLPPEIPAHYEVGYMDCYCEADFDHPDQQAPMSPVFSLADLSPDPGDELPF